MKKEIRGYLVQFLAEFLDDHPGWEPGPVSEEYHRCIGCSESFYPVHDRRGSEAFRWHQAERLVCLIEETELVTDDSIYRIAKARTATPAMKATGSTHDGRESSAVESSPNPDPAVESSPNPDPPE